MQGMKTLEYSGKPTTLSQKMKNGSTPRKCNLVNGQEPIDPFGYSFEGEWLALRERLLGKNTIQAARILAEEFVLRFWEDIGTVTDIVQKLIYGGRAPDWDELNRNISEFCRPLYELWETPWTFARQIPSGKNDSRWEAHVQFFDHAIDMLNSLPHKCDYKLPTYKAKYTAPRDIAISAVCCFLCWRSVFRKPLEKKNTAVS